MTKEIFIKYLNDKCSDQELEEVIQWLKNDSLNNQGKSWAMQDWAEFRVNDDIIDNVTLSSLLDKIHHNINITRQNNKKPVISIITWITRAAAILLIPVLAFLIYTQSYHSSELSQIDNVASDSISIVTPVGSQTVVQLSDGTEVYLNYGSKLKYPLYFTGENREVILTGEGYFDVAHNPDKPFVVKTEKLNIKALGTKFNVLAYPGGNVIAATLVDGKVVVEQLETSGSTNTIGTMIPGQHLSYDIKTGAISSSRGSIEKYIAWKDGKLVFENESITEVTSRLSRMFNVDFEIADNVKDYSYTVTFVDEPLSQILDLMTIATPVIYKILPRKKLPDGTFSKQKIILEKRS